MPEDIGAFRAQKNPDRHEWVRAEAFLPLFSDFLRGRKPVDKSHDAQTIRPDFPDVKHQTIRISAQLGAFSKPVAVRVILTQW
ncbi:hypothetical protein TH19_02635 [Thalassospira profundimaris]|uniref:Uncharacterized protein n=1 Tax=Thalassospira profundimaris TaxID=502049 RepID=A0A367WHF7_9PROT|nr:hypothetical protein TH19_02635 [Thalassospira profundimaris]